MKRAMSFCARLRSACGLVGKTKPRIVRFFRHHGAQRHHRLQCPVRYMRSMRRCRRRTQARPRGREIAAKIDIHDVIGQLAAGDVADTWRRLPPCS